MTAQSRRKPLLVPVRIEDGSLYHDTDYKGGAIDLATARAKNAQSLARNGHSRWGVSYVMGIITPFRVRIRVVEQIRSGHSVYVNVLDDVGRHWPMFITDLVDFLSDASLTDGWSDEATFETVKKGTAYGIRRVP
jgi:hypothetical protein